MKASGIYKEIYASLSADPDLLPVIPETAFIIRRKLSDKACTNKSAANILKSDPGLAAFIMRASNSARYYMFRGKPSDLESAVMRLGLTTILNLVTVYITRSIFAVKSPACKKLMVGGYQNATKVAVLSYFLADNISGVDAGKAMLGGLLQDISLPLLLTHLVKRPEIFNDKHNFLSAIDELSPLVSVLILKSWGFNDELIDVVRSRKQWLRSENTELDLSDIVLVARWHSLIGTDEFSTCPPFSEIPAFKKIPAEHLTADNSLKLIIDSRKEVEDLQKTLYATG